MVPPAPRPTKLSFIPCLRWNGCHDAETRRRDTTRVNSALTLSFGYVVLLAFWSVLVAELVGDKSIYNVASLSLRFRPGIVFASITTAFAAKALAAVSLAQLLVHLQSKWT